MVSGMKGTPESSPELEAYAHWHAPSTKETAPAQSHNDQPPAARKLSKLREVARSWVYSEEASQVLRYKHVTEEGAFFPYDGTVSCHIRGTIKRLNRFLRDETTLREEVGWQPLEVDRRLVKGMAAIHDGGEIGDQGDLPHGTKSEENERIEREQFERHARSIADPELRNAALIAAEHLFAETPEASPLVKTFKVTERLSFNETARRIWLAERGKTLNDDEENLRSGVHLELTPSRQDVQPLKESTRNADLVAWDITRNTLPRLLAEAQEYLAVRQYLLRHREQFIAMTQQYLGNLENNQINYARYQIVYESTPNESPEEVTEKAQRILAELQELQSERPSRKLALGWTELAEGHYTDLTG